jgi:hypothetical protein
VGVTLDLDDPILLVTGTLLDLNGVKRKWRVKWMQGVGGRGRRDKHSAQPHGLG